MNLAFSTVLELTDDPMQICGKCANQSREPPFAHTKLKCAQFMFFICTYTNVTDLLKMQDDRIMSVYMIFKVQYILIQLHKPLKYKVRLHFVMYKHISHSTLFSTRNSVFLILAF